MATWRQYDKLESTASKAGAEMAEFCSLLLDISPDLEPARAGVMEAARVLTEAMRHARRDAYGIVHRERGNRA